MERGTLSIIRQTENGPCSNLQRRINGKHCSEYIPPSQVPVVQQNIQAHRNFRALVDAYVEAISEQTRQQRLGGRKKKTPDVKIGLA